MIAGAELLPVITPASMNPANEVARALTGRDYISWSAISTLRSCPLKYFFRYVAALPEETVSSALVFGTGIHAAIEGFYRAEPAGEARPAVEQEFARILDAAKLPMWPRPFHILRASRETELADEFPIPVVCEWIGNSEEVARKHYLQVTEEHFQKATSHPPSQMHADGGTGAHAEKETAVSPACAKDTAAQIPPRGVEPRFSD